MWLGRARDTQDRLQGKRKEMLRQRSVQSVALFLLRMHMLATGVAGRAAAATAASVAIATRQIPTSVEGAGFDDPLRRLKSILQTNIQEHLWGLQVNQ